MTQPQLRMAFEASPELERHYQRFKVDMENNPDASHGQLIEPIANEFVDQVMSAFFFAPIDVVGAEGPVVSVVRSTVNVVKKAASAMIIRLVSKASADEQRALFKHFDELRLERDGVVYVCFPLDPGLANRMVMTFDESGDGRGDTHRLVEVMKGMSAAAIKYYLEDTLACLRLGPINRRITHTGRVTIEKAVVLAIEKALPALQPDHRAPVTYYFRSMLLEE